jgi:hypothetical protein
LTSVTGERTFFKRYSFDLLPLGATGVTFGGEDVIADPHAPNEPSCNIGMRVDYVFDPARPNELEQRREHVELAFANGKCTEVSRKIVPVQLVRADRLPVETHEIAMPVGPVEVVGKKKVNKKALEKAPPSKGENVKNLPLDPKAEALAKKKGGGKKAPPEDDLFTSTKTVKGGADKNLSPPPNAQIVPEPNAPAPQVQADIPQQQAAPPPQQQAVPKPAPQQKK